MKYPKLTLWISIALLLGVSCRQVVQGDDDTDVVQGDDDTDAEVVEASFTIVIANQTADPVYIRLTVDQSCLYGDPAVSIADGEEWNPLQFFNFKLDYCTCEKVAEDGFCDCEGDPENYITEILPGKELRLPWDGAVVTPDEYTGIYGTDACYWNTSLVSGHYRMTVDAYPDVSCWYEEPEDCVANENGKIRWASLEGNPASYAVAFVIPFDSDTLTLVLD